MVKPDTVTAGESLAVLLTTGRCPLKTLMVIAIVYAIVHAVIQSDVTALLEYDSTGRRSGSVRQSSGSEHPHPHRYVLQRVGRTGDHRTGGSAARKQGEMRDVIVRVAFPTRWCGV